VRRLLHRLAHRLGWNDGTLYLLRHDGRYYLAFRCGCGEVTHAREVNVAEALRWGRLCVDTRAPAPGPAPAPHRRRHA
jgi:hypothetical protein